MRVPNVIECLHFFCNVGQQVELYEEQTYVIEGRKGFFAVSNNIYKPDVKANSAAEESP